MARPALAALTIRRDDEPLRRPLGKAIGVVVIVAVVAPAVKPAAVADVFDASGYLVSGRGAEGGRRRWCCRDVTISAPRPPLPALTTCKAADARVEQIRVDLRDMVVRAPFDGTIVTKNTEVGEVISSLTVDAFPGKWRGYLDQIIPTADRAKGIVQVKVSIDDPMDGLLAEMSATVAFAR